MTPAGMIEVRLSEEEREALAQRVVEMLADRMRAGEDRWMDSRDAAAYLCISRDALDKYCAARAIPFQQAGPGCKRWFLKAELDAWRRGLN